MTLSDMKIPFLSMPTDKQLDIIKRFRYRRYELATKPRSRPKSIITLEKKRQSIDEKFANLPKELQDSILKQLEERISK